MSYDPTQQPWGPQSYPYGQRLSPADPYAAPTSGPFPPVLTDPYAGQQPAGYPTPTGFPPPPPPPKRNTTPIVVGILAVTTLIIAVCGVSGWLISTADTTSTDPSPTASASKSPSARASVDGSRPEVSPAGAPYSWRVPAGFQEITPAKADSPASAKFPSGAAQTPTPARDLIVVDMYELPYDADAAEIATLETGFDRIVRGIGQDPATRETSTTNGYRSLRYGFTYPDSAAYSYFLFKGTTEIQVRCQWAKAEAAIKTGCEDLLYSLTIT